MYLWGLVGKSRFMFQQHHILGQVQVGAAAAGLLLCALLKVVGASRDTGGENYG